MNLQGQLLVATQDMDDEYFDRAVIYLCDHSEQGSMGLMINAPTDLSVMELLVKMDFLMANERNYTKDQLVLNGGPVSPERGFILHTATAEPFLHSYTVAENRILTTSSDVVDTLGRDNAPEKFMVCLGCCTWKSGQLEEEIERNLWLTAPADEAILFETGYLDRWARAYELLGVANIPHKVGRA